MSTEKMKDCVDIYNAIELLNDNDYITKDEYHRMNRTLLRTTIGMMVFEVNKEVEDNADSN